MSVVGGGLDVELQAGVVVLVLRREVTQEGHVDDLLRVGVDALLGGLEELLAGEEALGLLDPLSLLME